MSRDGPSVTGRSASTRVSLGFFLAAACIALVAFVPAFSGGWLFDDIPLLVNQQCWRGLERVPALFSFDADIACTYRPVRYLTFALDYSIGGLDPVLFHASNFIYHLVTGALVFVLFRRFTSAPVAALGLLLWLIHPVQADSVAYISGRRDVVSTLFFVAGALVLVPPRGKRIGVVRAIGGLLLYGLALQAKEMAVTLPAVVIWLVLVGRGSATLRSHLRRYWPVYGVLAGSAVAFVVYRGVLSSASAMQGRWWGGSPAANFATSFALYGRYLQLLVWPHPLIGDYFYETIPLAEGFGDPRAWVGIALYAGLVGLTVVAWRRGWRTTAMGLGWFLITMLPVSHILPHHELFAEHYLYLPSIGLFMAVLPLLAWLVGSVRVRRWAGGAALGAVVVAFVLTTRARSAEFENELVFYTAAHERAPDNLRVLHYLGVILTERGECEQALPLLGRSAPQLNPQSVLGRDSAVAFLMCSGRLGEREGVDEVIADLLEAHPDDLFGLAWRGRRHFEEGRLGSAVTDLTEVVARTQSRERDAVLFLSMALNRQRRYEDALAVIRGAPSDRRDNRHCEQEVLALVSLGVARYEEAFNRVNQCLDAFPRAPILLELRSGLFSAAGRPDLARADIQRLIELGASDEQIARARAQLEP